MSWKGVGDWIKENAGTGASLVGSLLTGNLPGAVAAGVSLVSGATGTDDPVKALAALQNDPETMIKLKELAVQENQNIRKHLEEMTRLDLEDKQNEHQTTQQTVQAGDKAQDRFVRWTRPGQSWCSLFFAFYYIHTSTVEAEIVEGVAIRAAQSPDVTVVGILLALPFAYAGLRQVGKGVNAFMTKTAVH